ncbi:MAG: hypothetical protein HDR48_01515 [Bacteroides sp.]|nr:hypothetical protein [Bacteroides sp.]MDE7462424.1 hypothetical protein [Muribaculaceae bacterium]
MKKSMLLIGLAALMLGACSGNEKKLAEDSAAIAALKNQYNEANSFNDSLLLLMGDIYTGLDSINAQEGLLYRTGGGEGVDRREEVRQNLAAIRARLEANKALLDELQAKANASGQQNSVLNKTIEQLKVRIEQQDAKISELTQQLESANQQISELNTKVEEGEKNLAQANTELADQKAETVAAENLANRVYYAIGTNKELKKNGLLEKKFLGRTKVMEGDFNQNYFTVGDKRTLSVIPTGSKKAEIKTNMPEGSYEIVGGKDENKSIRILNPTKFWSLSPYLIIQVD